MLFLCRCRGKSVCSDAEVYSGQWWSWTSCKVVTTTWKTPWACASDTALARNSRVYLCSWETGGGCRKRGLGRKQGWTTPGMKQKSILSVQPPGRSVLIEPLGQGIELATAFPLSLLPLSVHHNWSHSCSQHGQTRLALGRLSQYMHQVPLLHVFLLEEEQGELWQTGASPAKGL